jgi:hypothetical protein
MAIFTLIGAAIFGAGTFLAAATSVALSLAATIGVSTLMRTASGDQQKPAPYGIQGKMNAGGDVPRSFILGRYNTAGSLSYHGTWGAHDDTPNAYYTRVIPLSDLPAQSLDQVYVNGALCTVDLDPARAHPYGNPLVEFRKDNEDHCWVKFYDGTQTAADPFMLSVFAAHPTRPYGADRIGTGVAYVIVTALVNEKLFSGFPAYKFTLTGAKLYDPSKDSTAGGTGAQRYSDRSTWGGDGDHLAAVQLYNVLRGISYNGAWLYGLQGLAAARVPASNWLTQIAKCRAPVTGVAGPEPSYRAAGEIFVSMPGSDGVQKLLTACNGRLSEIGGSYKLNCGAPGTSTFSFTDADIISDEEQSFTPFFGLADTVNGIVAKYPAPDQGWNVTPAPPIYRSDLEARAGNRRLLSNVSLDLVPFAAQVQRLCSATIEEAQRARKHTFVLPPFAQQIEPGDIVDYTSARNGYAVKLFRADGVIDTAKLNVIVDLTEVDPSDYDWNHAADFVPSVSGPIDTVRPAAQDIALWDADGDVVVDDASKARRPAIRLSWDGSKKDVDAVEYAVRLASSGAIVHRGRTDSPETGFTKISESLLPATAYQAQGRYLTASRRETLWSDWLSCTTPDIRVGLDDVDAGIKYQITTLQQQVAIQLATFSFTLNDAIAETAAVAHLNKVIVNQQAYDHRIELINRIAIGDSALGASITDVRTLATGTQDSLAQYQLLINATLGSGFSSVNTVSLAIANANSVAAQASSDINAKLGSGFSNVNTVSLAIANANSVAAQASSDINAKLGSGFSNVNTVSLAIASANSVAAQASSDINAKLGSGFSNVNTVSLAIANANSVAAQASSDINAKLGSGFSNVNTVSLAIASANSTAAQASSDINAKLGSGFSNVNTVSLAIANANSTAAQATSDLSATLGSGFSNVNTVALAISNASGTAAQASSDINAKLGSGFSNVSTVASAIATLNGYAAEVTVSTNVNGYIAGTKLINGGAGLSAFIVQADRFQIQLPGWNGSAPVPVFTTGTVNGVASIGITGDIFLDGTLWGVALRANTVHANRLIAGTITSASGAIGALGVQSLSIGDNAVTVPRVQSIGTINVITVGQPQTIASFNVPVDVTGLAGKNVTVYANCVFIQSVGGGAAALATAATLFVNGSSVFAYSYPSGAQPPVFTLAGSLDIAVGAGVTTLSIPVSVSWQPGNNSGTSTQVVGGVLFAMAVKR